MKATRKKIADNMMSLRDKEIKIYKGDIIVKKGEIIDSDAFLKLEKLIFYQSLVIPELWLTENLIR